MIAAPSGDMGLDPIIGMKAGGLTLVNLTELTTDRAHVDATFTEEQALFMQR